MPHPTLEFFGIACDNRSKYWYNMPEDNFFPYDADYHPSFIVRGFGTPDSVVYYTFSIYDLKKDELDKTSVRTPLFSSRDNAVSTTANGYYYSEIFTDWKMPCPPAQGGVDVYEATIEHDGEVLRTIQFYIANIPTDISALVTPLQLSTSVSGTSYDDGLLDVAITLSSMVDYPFPLVIGGYLPRLAEGEKLFDREGQVIPDSYFQRVDFRPGFNHVVRFTFQFDVDESDETRPYHFVLAVAGQIFFDIPLDDASDGIREGVQRDLIPFVVKPPHFDDGEPLMPADFAEMLHYLDKRAEFARSLQNGRKEWHRRHLILTGKRGTGKRTAARLLAKKLCQSALATGMHEVDAIELLDPTNGFSPNMENMIDQHQSQVIIINDAEALTLKGSVGVLNGMEILANKMKKLGDTTVVLLGKKGRMEELVNLCEPARELFYTFYTFDDVSPGRMLSITLGRLAKEGFRMTPEAVSLFGSFLERSYNLRGNNFSNMYFAQRIVDDEIMPRLVRRTVSDQLRVEGNPTLITGEDIPQAEVRDPAEPLRKLESLIGLDNVKKSIINHTALVRLNKIRSDRGLYNRMPPMHMVFTGNPGTGKTTIAEYLGEIYRGIGALSIGHLVQTDRSKLVGQYIGDTEKNTLNAIQRASGGVLFIDEAYNLFVRSDDNRDFGMRVIETLLTYLSMEDTDMIVILAGYTNEMKAMLESNPGLKSRFPYIFHFDDYSPEQLLGIGKLVLQKEQYTLTPQAEKALSKYIIEEYNQKDEHFGNGRFITRLLKSHIIPSVGQRLSQLPPERLTDEMLSLIEEQDIPRHDQGVGTQAPVDDTILDTTLDHLDQLVGLAQAKQTLHDYVTTVRLERAQGVGRPAASTLYWNFIGNTGTGKSTVAELLAKLMQGLGLLKRGHLVTLNIEELTSGDMFNTIEKSLKRAVDGLLFMDMDSPRYRNQNTDNIRLWIVNKIRETRQQTAVVFAEAATDNSEAMRSIASNGIFSLSHSVVFDDFTPEELMQLLTVMLSSEHRLEVGDDAVEPLRSHLDQLCRTAPRTAPANARTVQMLAQQVAQAARLRMVAHPDSPGRVTVADVETLRKTQVAHHTRIGF